MVSSLCSCSEVQYVVLQNVATMSIKRRVRLGLNVGELLCWLWSGMRASQQGHQGLGGLGKERGQGWH